jgi:signal peptidase
VEYGRLLHRVKVGGKKGKRRRMNSDRFSLQPQTITYTGGSMKPIFRDGDALTVEPYVGKKRRVGDIVVFMDPENNQKIIHRIVSIRQEGIRTQGDHSTQLDPWILEPGEIIGKVVSARRGNSKVRVITGLAGHIQALAFRTWVKMDDLASPLLHSSYRWLSRKGLVRRLMGGNSRIRILSLQKPEGVEYQLLFKNHPIGRRRPGSLTWEIKRPYRLLIDESTLP